MLSSVIHMDRYDVKYLLLHNWMEQNVDQNTVIHMDRYDVKYLLHNWMEQNVDSKTSKTEEGSGGQGVGGSKKKSTCMHAS